MRHTHALTVTGAALTVALTVAACAPTSPNIDGIGGTSTPNPTVIVDDSGNEIPIDTIPTDTPLPAPTITPPNVTEPPENYNPDEPVEFPVTADFTAEPINGYTVDEVTDATRYAMSFTQARYAIPGLWLPPQRRSNPQAPTTYYGLTNYLNNAAQEDMSAILLEPDTMLDNTTFLLFAPQPPAGDYQWLTPAVADFTFGQPTYGYDGDDLIVAFAYTARAIHTSSSGYTAIPIDGLLYVTLTQTRDGWRVVSLEGSERETYGAPVPLENRPDNRTITLEESP